MAVQDAARRSRRAGSPSTRRRDSGRGRQWWRSAAIYQVYPRSFADGDGDGTGDLLGVLDRLPYLRDLGVDAIWFTPWYPSPMADGGYDVADYRAIDPAFGDLAPGRGGDRDRGPAGHPHHRRRRPEPHLGPAPLVPAGAGRRAGLARAAAVLVPPRHAARTASCRPTAGSPTSAARPGAGTTGADGTPGEWYLHLFAPGQPDLNWGCPDVRAEFEDVLRFWFDREVAGVRIDSAALLVKDPEPARAARTSPARASTRTSTATSCRTSTGPGGRSRTATAGARWSARSGCRTSSASVATCARTCCTPPSTSTS